MTIDPPQPVAPLSGAAIPAGRQTGRRAANTASAEPFAHTLRRALGTGRPGAAAEPSTPASSEAQATSLNSQNAQSTGSSVVSNAVLLDLLETLVASETSMWSAPQNSLGLNAYMNGYTGSIAGATSPLSAVSPLSALTGSGSPLSQLSSLVNPGSLPTSLIDSSQPSGSAGSSSSGALPSQTAGATATDSPAAVRTALQPVIASLAAQYGLSPQLVNALITQESGYNPAATSSAGAMGLMQLMPATAASLGVANPYDPVANLRGGMQYLSGLLKQYNGNLPLALAAYNAGPGAVSEYGGVPPYPQTQQYVANIMSQISTNLP